MQPRPKRCKMEHLLVMVLLFLSIHGSGKKAMAQNDSWVHLKRWYRAQLDLCVWWWEMLLIPPCWWKQASPSGAEESVHMGGLQGKFVGSEPWLQWQTGGRGVHRLLLILEPSCPRDQAGISLGCLARGFPSEVRLFINLMLMPLASTSRESPQGSLCFVSLRKWHTQIHVVSKTDDKC